MCSLAAVLILMIGGINVFNYINLDREADETLDALADNGGWMPKFFGIRAPGQRFGIDSPFNDRWYTVLLAKDGSVLRIDVSRIPSVDSDTAAASAALMQKKGSTGGYSSDFKYRAVDTMEGTLYIFLDCGRELDTFRAFLVASAAASVCGFAAVFVMVLFLSEVALRPVTESLEKQKRFITDAGHELKTPLSVISADTDLLELENGESEWSQSIRNQVERMRSLTDKLVFLSRMEESGGFEMAPFAISDAVAESVESFRAPAASRGLTLDTQIEEGLTLDGSEYAIRQLTSLLMDNARKYASEGGRVLVTLKRNERRIQFTVANTVNDLSQENPNRLFERFYRPDASRSTSTGGFGIGLSAAKAIVDAHKGRIGARYEKRDDGNYIIFEISL